MTPPYPPQPGWAPPPSGDQQSGGPRQQFPPFQQRPNPPVPNTAKSGNTVIAGILAILCGLLYLAGVGLGSYSGAITGNSRIFDIADSLILIAAGILLFTRRRLGTYLANLGGGSVLFFSLLTTVVGLIKMRFDQGGYVGIPLFLLAIALLVLANMPTTRRSCTSWETQPPRRPATSPMLAAITATIFDLICVAAIVLTATNGEFTYLILATTVGVVLLSIGVILLFVRRPAGQILATIGAGIIIGPNAFNDLPSTFHYASTTNLIVLIIVLVLGVATTIIIGLPATDHAMMTRQPANPAPVQFAPGEQPPQFQRAWPPPAQQGQFHQQPPGWPQQPPRPPQQPPQPPMNR